jgi:hypothetical protein
MLRVTGWATHLRTFVEGREFCTEEQLTEVLLLAGRQMNKGYRGVIAHAMRSLGWRRRRDRAFVRKVPRVAASVEAGRAS